MNKQALSFLTLFSLVLLLAVYYVMLPVENGEYIAPQVTQTIESMEQALNEKRAALEKQYTEILAGVTEDAQAKEAALEALNDIHVTQDKEKELVNVLMLAGFEGCLVEYSEKSVKAVCPKQLQTQENVTKILRLIAQTATNAYTPELSFK